MLYSEDICLQTLTSFSITWIKITRACGWQKNFRAGQILSVVPGAFIYSLQRNFATQIAFIIFVIGMKW